MKEQTSKRNVTQSVQGNDFLGHYDFLDTLTHRKNDLESHAQQARLRLKDSPDEMLRVVRNGRYHCYYARKGMDKNGSYISKSNMEYIAALAQKKYDTLFLDEAKKEISLINSFLDSYSDNIADINSFFNNELRNVIDVEDMSDEEYIDYWMSIPYTPMTVEDDIPKHITERGEVVRSKSEELIANTLNRLGIPYKYECPLYFANGGVRYPDFTILNVKNRKVWFYEHFGMMDDHDYMNSCFGKILEYGMNGFYPGIDYFMTFETINYPLNTRTIEKTIKMYLR